MEPQTNESQSVIEPLKKVTPVSKYLAMALFIILPFLGAWVGYSLAPEKVVEIERVIEKEVVVDYDDAVNEPTIATTEVSQEIYNSPNGFSIAIPIGVEVVEEPAQLSYSAVTNFTGDFGSMCISPSYGCGGKGAEGAKVDTAILTSQEGVEMNVTLLRGDGSDSVAMIVQSLKPLPSGFTDSAQIQVFTTEEKLPLAESILTSIKFLE